MKVLVTGGTGFLGRHMVTALLGQGDDVSVLVRSKQKAGMNANSKLSLREGNITIPESIRGITDGIDIIYHFAAQLGEWGLPEDLLYSVNVKGTQNLLNTCQECSNPRFVFISTPGVQGKGHAAADEGLPYNPPYIYEKTKCEAEKLVLTYGRENGIPWVIARPDFVYGPGDYRRVSLYRAILNKRFLIIGNGKSVLHPTYIDDVIHGLLKMGQAETGLGEIYNIAGPEQLCVEQYIMTMAEVMGVNVPRIKIPLIIGKIFASLSETASSYTGRPPFISHSKIEFLTRDHGSDITKAKKRLGYSPQYGFMDGFRLTYHWAKQNNLL